MPHSAASAATAGSRPRSLRSQLMRTPGFAAARARTSRSVGAVWSAASWPSASVPSARRRTSTSKASTAVESAYSTQARLLSGVPSEPECAVIRVLSDMRINLPRKSKIHGSPKTLPRLIIIKIAPANNPCQTIFTRILEGKAVSAKFSKGKRGPQRQTDLHTSNPEHPEPKFPTEISSPAPQRALNRTCGAGSQKPGACTSVFAPRLSRRGRRRSGIFCRFLRNRQKNIGGF